MKYKPIILIIFLLFSITSIASAEVTLILTEPYLKGGTDIRIFYASNGSFLGNATTDGSPIVFDEGQSYIAQVLPTGISFAQDPVANFDYMQRGIPAMFSVGLGIVMILVVVASVLILLYGRKNKGR